MDDAVSVLNENQNCFWKLYCLGNSCLDTMATLASQDGNRNGNANSKSVDFGRLTSAQTKRSSFEFGETERKSPYQSDSISLSPLIATLSNEISNFFVLRPIDFQNLVPRVVPCINTKSLSQTIEGFKNVCAQFTSCSSISTADFTQAEVKIWKAIHLLINQIIGMSYTAVSVFNETSLESIILAMERILDAAPRYVLQSFELSNQKQYQISRAQMISFVDKIVATNTRFERQRASHKNQEMEVTLDKIWDAAKQKMVNQCGEMNLFRHDHLKDGFINKRDTTGPNCHILQEHKNCISLSTQKIDEIRNLVEKIDRVAKQHDNQRYSLKPTKQKEMFLEKVQNHIDRLGGRVPSQDALSKADMKDIKFSEIDRILNSFSQRYAGQSADGIADRFSKQRRSSSIENTGAESRSQNMYEKRAFSNLPSKSDKARPSKSDEVIMPRINHATIKLEKYNLVESINYEMSEIQIIGKKITLPLDANK